MQNFKEGFKHTDVKLCDSWFCDQGCFFVKSLHPEMSSPAIAKWFIAWDCLIVGVFALILWCLYTAIL